MRVLVIGPPLYGLLYPVISLAQGLRASGHDVVVGTAGDMSHRVAEAGLVSFDAAPGLDPDAEYRRREEERKRADIGTAPGDFSFFSHEMTDRLVEFTGSWTPDLIIYPPLGVVGRLLGARFGIPTVLQTVGFAHQQKHVDTVTHSLREKFAQHGVSEPREDLTWLDVAPPSMSVLDHPSELTMPLRYVPYNGGAVFQDWWVRPDRPRVLVSLGTLKPMVDGLDLIDWVLHRADELDAQVVLQLKDNAREELVEELPDNVTLTDWIPMGGLVENSDVFIHHGGAGNTFTALAAGVPQIVFGEGADRPMNARIVQERGCGIVPGDGGLTAETIRSVVHGPEYREQAEEVRSEIRGMPGPAEVADRLSGVLVGV